jgi:uncharacterized protein YpmB
MANASIFVDVIKIMTVIFSVIAVVVLLICTKKSVNKIQEKHSKPDNSNKTENQKS